MEHPEAARAVDAAVSAAAACGLAVDYAAVLHNSNNLLVHLSPCDVVARIAPVGHENAHLEVEIAEALRARGSPVAALEPRAEPRIHERDGFVITLWSYYKMVRPSPEL